MLVTPSALISSLPSPPIGLSSTDPAATALGVSRRTYLISVASQPTAVAPAANIDGTNTGPRPTAAVGNGFEALAAEERRVASVLDVVRAIADPFGSTSGGAAGSEEGGQSLSPDTTVTQAPLPTPEFFYRFRAAVELGAIDTNATSGSSIWGSTAAPSAVVPGGAPTNAAPMALRLPTERRAAITAGLWSAAEDRLLLRLRAAGSSLCEGYLAARHGVPERFPKDPLLLAMRGKTIAAATPDMLTGGAGGFGAAGSSLHGLMNSATIGNASADPALLHRLATAQAVEVGRAELQQKLEDRLRALDSVLIERKRLLVATADIMNEEYADYSSEAASGGGAASAAAKGAGLWRQVSRKVALATALGRSPSPQRGAASPSPHRGSFIAATGGPVGTRVDPAKDEAAAGTAQQTEGGGPTVALVCAGGAAADAASTGTGSGSGDGVPLATAVATNTPDSVVVCNAESVLDQSHVLRARAAPVVAATPLAAALRKIATDKTQELAAAASSAAVAFHAGQNASAGGVDVTWSPSRRSVAGPGGASAADIAAAAAAAAANAPKVLTPNEFIVLDETLFTSGPAAVLPSELKRDPASTPTAILSPPNVERFVRWCNDSAAFEEWREQRRCLTGLHEVLQRVSIAGVEQRLQTERAACHAALTHKYDAAEAAVVASVQAALDAAVAQVVRTFETHLHHGLVEVRRSLTDEQRALDAFFDAEVAAMLHARVRLRHAAYGDEARKALAAMTGARKRVEDILKPDVAAFLPSAGWPATTSPPLNPRSGPKPSAVGDHQAPQQQQFPTDIREVPAPLRGMFKLALHRASASALVHQLLIAEALGVASLRSALENEIAARIDTCVSLPELRSPLLHESTIKSIFTAAPLHMLVRIHRTAGRADSRAATAASELRLRRHAPSYDGTSGATAGGAFNAFDNGIDNERAAALSVLPVSGVSPQWYALIEEELNRRRGIRLDAIGHMTRAALQDLRSDLRCRRRSYLRVLARWRTRNAFEGSAAPADAAATSHAGGTEADRAYRRALRMPVGAPSGLASREEEAEWSTTSASDDESDSDHDDTAANVKGAGGEYTDSQILLHVGDSRDGGAAVDVVPTLLLAEDGDDTADAPLRITAFEEADTSDLVQLGVESILGRDESGSSSGSSHGPAHDKSQKQRSGSFVGSNGGPRATALDTASGAARAKLVELTTAFMACATDPTDLNHRTLRSAIALVVEQERARQRQRIEDAVFWYGDLVASIDATLMAQHAPSSTTTGAATADGDRVPPSAKGAASSRKPAAFLAPAGVTTQTSLWWQLLAITSGAAPAAIALDPAAPSQRRILKCTAPLQQSLFFAHFPSDAARRRRCGASSLRAVFEVFINSGVSGGAADGKVVAVGLDCSPYSLSDGHRGFLAARTQQQLELQHPKRRVTKEAAAFASNFGTNAAGDGPHGGCWDLDATGAGMAAALMAAAGVAGNPTPPPSGPVDGAVAASAPYVPGTLPATPPILHRRGKAHDAYHHGSSGGGEVDASCYGVLWTSRGLLHVHGEVFVLGPTGVFGSGDTLLVAVDEGDGTVRLFRNGQLVPSPVASFAAARLEARMQAEEDVAALADDSAAAAATRRTAAIAERGLFAGVAGGGGRAGGSGQRRVLDHAFQGIGPCVPCVYMFDVATPPTRGAGTGSGNGTTIDPPASALATSHSSASPSQRRASAAASTATKATGAQAGLRAWVTDPSGTTAVGGAGQFTRAVPGSTLPSVICDLEGPFRNPLPLELADAGYLPYRTAERLL